MATTSLPLPLAATAPRMTPRNSAHRRLLDRRLVGQLVRYSVIGVSSTVFQLGLYLVLRDVLGPLTANLIAVVVSTVANTTANRAVTFGIRGRRGAGRHQAKGLLLFALSLGLTSGALSLLGVVAPNAPQSAELVVLVAVNTLLAVGRFALLRGWVFRADTPPRGGQRVMPVWPSE